MKGQSPLKRNTTSALFTYLTGLSNKIYIDILFVLSVAILLSLNGIYYFIIYKDMSTAA